MSTIRRPRKGSLQFWPRKRASKFLPRVNWSSIDSKHKIKGFIGYKVGMASAFVKDETPNSMTKGKKIIIPVTILECPPMRVFSIRLYKNGIVKTEILAENLEKELKKKIKFPKKKHKLENINPNDYDDVSILCHSKVKKTGIKKSPDISEIGLSGTIEEKINFAREKLGKEIEITDIFEKRQVVDLIGLTKGHGFSGAVKRFGITLKSHKSEKGRRKPGSLGPWHPARVTYKTPMAGQLGMFSRKTLNNNIVDMGKSEGKFKNIKNYGEIKTDYLIVRGSVQGPAKRQVIITAPSRATKKQSKKIYELIDLR